MKTRMLAAILTVLMLVSAIVSPLPVLAKDDYVTIRLHYHRPDGDYTGWEAWLWDIDSVTTLSPPYSLTVDSVHGDAVCEFQVKSGTSRIGYIFRKNRWDYMDVNYDQHINITGVLSGTVDFYVESSIPTQGNATSIPTRNDQIASGNLVLGDDVTIGTNLISASYKVGYGGDPMLEVRLGGELAPTYTIEDFQIIDGRDVAVPVQGIHRAGSYIYLRFGQELDLFQSYSVTFNGEKYAVELPEPEFVLGDVTRDGKVNAKDLALLYGYVSQVQTLAQCPNKRLATCSLIVCMFTVAVCATVNFHCVLQQKFFTKQNRYGIICIERHACVKIL